jgi:predicted O-methyltransferase YrrM
MNEERWAAVDEYIAELLVQSDAVLDSVLESATAAGLPAIHVSVAQGKFLNLVARIMQAQRILELGTLAGYSTIWLARALPANGKLITLEVDPQRAQIAKANFLKANLGDKIELRLGEALNTLPLLFEQNPPPFDLIFIDADKPNIPHYFAWALKLARPGSLIIVDNVVRNGEVINAQSDDPNVKGVRQLNDIIAAEPRVSATVIQTVGSKGYDGFLFAQVLS